MALEWGEEEGQQLSIGHVKAEISVSYPNVHVSEQSQQKDWAGLWHVDSD